MPSRGRHPWAPLGMPAGSERPEPGSSLMHLRKQTPHRVGDTTPSAHSGDPLMPYLAAVIRPPCRPCRSVPRPTAFGRPCRNRSGASASSPARGGVDPPPCLPSGQCPRGHTVPPARPPRRLREATPHPSPGGLETVQMKRRRALPQQPVLCLRIVFPHFHVVSGDTTN